MEARGAMEVVEVVEVVEEIETPQYIETSVSIASDLPSNDSVENMSFEKIAALVLQCQTWSEVAAITSFVDEPTRRKSWDILSKPEQQRQNAMKEAFVPSIKVGDKVNWENHFPYLSSWLPLKVEEINDGKVKLELCVLVPIEELSLVS